MTDYIALHGRTGGLVHLGSREHGLRTMCGRLVDPATLPYAGTDARDVNCRQCERTHDYRMAMLALAPAAAAAAAAEVVVPGPVSAWGNGPAEVEATLAVKREGNYARVTVNYGNTRDSVAVPSELLGELRGALAELAPETEAEAVVGVTVGELRELRAAVNAVAGDAGITHPTITRHGLDKINDALSELIARAK